MIKRNLLSIYLLIVLVPFSFRPYFKQIKKKYQKEHCIHHLITRFILQYENHPLCIQFIQLPNNSWFLMQLALKHYLPHSITFHKLLTIHRLVSIIYASDTYCEMGDSWFVVSDTWTQETGWSAAFATPKTIHNELFPKDIYI